MFDKSINLERFSFKNYLITQIIILCKFFKRKFRFVDWYPKNYEI